MTDEEKKIIIEQLKNISCVKKKLEKLINSDSQEINIHKIKLGNIGKFAADKFVEHSKFMQSLEKTT